MSREYLSKNLIKKVYVDFLKTVDRAELIKLVMDFVENKWLVIV
jgi:hypothetical protein